MSTRSKPLDIHVWRTLRQLAPGASAAQLRALYAKIREFDRAERRARWAG